MSVSVSVRGRIRGSHVSKGYESSKGSMGTE